MEGDIKEAHLLVNLIEVVEKASQVGVPVLSYGRDIFPQLGAYLLQKFLIKAEADVLDSVETQSVDPGLPDVPEEPFADLFADDRVAHVDVHAHQVVKIAFLRICVLLPLFAFKAVDHALLFGEVIVVCSGKMCVIPGEFAVFAFSPGECEF